MKTTIYLTIAFIVGLLACELVAQEVNSDPNAYAFAKREAQIQANRERVGHFLGIAPGCRFAGVGSSNSTARPNHCTTNRYRLVARAFAIGRSGKVYWSAHYR